MTDKLTNFLLNSDINIEVDLSSYRQFLNDIPMMIKTIFTNNFASFLNTNNRNAPFLSLSLFRTQNSQMSSFTSFSMVL